VGVETFVIKTGYWINLGSVFDNFVLFNSTYQLGFDMLLVKLWNLGFFYVIYTQGCALSQVAKKFTLFSQHLGVEIMTKVQILPVIGFIQIVVVGDVTLCGLEDRYVHFRDACCLHLLFWRGRGRFFETVSTPVPNYMAGMASEDLGLNIAMRVLRVTGQNPLW